METLHLTFVGRYTTKKDGSPLVTKAGKPYTSLRIKCNEYGDQFLSGFEGYATQGWKEGDSVEVLVEKKGDYLNFSVPKKEDVRAVELENKITTLTLRFNKLMGVLVDKNILEMPKQMVPGTDVEYPEGEVKEPFSGPGVGGANDEDPLEGMDPFADRIIES